MRNLFSIYLFFCSISTFAMPMELDLRTGLFVESSDSMPIRTIENFDDSIIITYKIPTASILNDYVYQNTILWQIKGFGTNNIPGEPAFPIKLDIFEIPDSTIVTISVTDTSFVEYSYELAPARLPLTDSGDDYYSTENVPVINPYTGFTPNNIVEKGDEHIYRKKSLQTIKFYPVQYDYTNKIVRAYTFIRYKIVFQKITESRLIEQNPSNTESNILSASNSAILNSDYQTGGIIYQDYLIISTTKYLEAVEKFANWKELMGFNMHIELRDNWQSTSEVKDVITNIYNKNPQLSFLLIIGDVEDVPSSTSTWLFEHITDLYYSCMDGDGDYISDIFQGRLPVSTKEEAMIAIDKIIQYEQAPPSNSSFYNKGLNCAVFEDRLNSSGQKIPDTYADRRFAQTAEEIRQYLNSLDKDINRAYFTDSNVTPMFWNKGAFSVGEAIPVELLKPTFAWNATYTDIINEINQGCLYVLFRGHGAPTYWVNPEFKTSHIDLLENTNFLPVVFSISCSTGNFGYSQPCIAEKFIRYNNGGAVAVYGATEDSFSGHNDALISGMIDAIWPNPGLRPIYGTSTPLGSNTPEPTLRLGQILHQGLTRLMETYGSGNKTYNKYHSEIFHCFGDPSMRIYSEAPTALSSISIIRNDSIGEISIDLNGILADITVCDHWNDTVICYRGDLLKYKTLKPQYVSISVSGVNLIPFISYGKKPNIINIQNETITTDTNIEADIIKIGTNITNLKPKGDVIINDGETNISATKIIIKPNTTITSDSKITLTIK